MRPYTGAMTGSSAAIAALAALAVCVIALHACQGGASCSSSAGAAGGAGYSSAGPYFSHQTGRGGAGHPPLDPEGTAERDRADWLAAGEADGIAGYDTEALDSASDALRYHQTAPAINYGKYVSDVALDARTEANHRAWVAEMKPWSGSLRGIDTLDEALEASTNFVGLRRPQSVAQRDPFFITEKDSSTYAKNPKFNFRQ